MRNYLVEKHTETFKDSQGTTGEYMTKKQLRDVYGKEGADQYSKPHKEFRGSAPQAVP